MSIFSKLQFWKKGDDLGDFDLGKEQGPAPLGLESASSQSLGQPQNSPFQNQQSYSDPGFGQSSFQTPSSQDNNFGFSPQGSSTFRSSTPSAPMPPSNQDYIVSKEIELISSKLDSLRSSIETVNARLSNLERMMESDSQRRRW